MFYVLHWVASLRLCASRHLSVGRTSFGDERRRLGLRRNVGEPPGGARLDSANRVAPPTRHDRERVNQLE